MGAVTRWAAAMAIAAAGVTLAAQAPQPSRSQHGRLFPPQDLGLLEAPDRDEWQRPHQILDALGVAEASVVADVGAGSGWFTVRLARRVGPNGKVYAQDVQQEMLAATTRRVRREGLANVTPVLGRGSDPALPAGALDAALVVDVLHEIEDRVTLLANLGKALKPGGLIGIVDFKPGGAGPGPDPGERVPPEEVERDATRAGLVLRRRETFLPFQYFLVFGRQETTATPAAAGSSARTRGAAPARPRP
ncbi:MAG: class I SAM-dependent methyltransferase [Acidobacteria bacterium]|nr:class I SAM-dependent methyltransferase [Acidobacteriota bacterium]